MRKLASVERIISVYPHNNADKLELIKVLGYQCVVQKGKYSVDDLIIYIKPDTILPENDWAIEFKKYAPKRIKAIKLRGEWSEGLVADTSILENIEIVEGYDVTMELCVTHYEPPIPNDINAKGPIPFNIPITDEERWENIPDILPFGEIVDITLKVDGQSSSYYFHNNEFGAIGRKLELKLDCDNKYTYHIKNINIEEKLKKYCIENNVSLCIRGESHGKGIQTMEINPHSKIPNSWKMFSIWNIKDRRYERKGDKYYFLNVCDMVDLPTVDVIEHDVVLTPELIQKYSKDLIELNKKPFEGVVVQHNKGSFKIINKYYDSKK